MSSDSDVQLLLLWAQAGHVAARAFLAVALDPGHPGHPGPPGPTADLHLDAASSCRNGYAHVSTMEEGGGGDRKAIATRGAGHTGRQEDGRGGERWIGGDGQIVATRDSGSDGHSAQRDGRGHVAGTAVGAAKRQPLRRCGTGCSTGGCWRRHRLLRALAAAPLPVPLVAAVAALRSFDRQVASESLPPFPLLLVAAVAALCSLDRQVASESLPVTARWHPDATLSPFPPPPLSVTVEYCA